MSLKQLPNGKSAMQEGSYTPVVFPLESDVPFSPSIASDTSSNKPKSFAYLAELSRKHEAFLKVMQEAPLCPSDPNEEADQEAREERISALRQRVHEARLKADGNPADSKWIFVTQLLHLGVTSGRNGRWIGVKPDLKPSEEVDVPGLGWINAKTESEWKEWEKKYNQERRVKDKVENWQKKIVPPSKRPSLQSSQGSSKGNRVTGLPSSKTSLNVVADPLQSAAPLGFSVVKRLSQKNITGKPSNSDKTPSRSDDTNNPSNPPAAKQISDINEVSFLPPSFRSSQLATSTPNPPAKPSTLKKPEPIPRNAPPSPPTPSVIPDSDRQHPPSSSPLKTYGRHNKIQSLNQPLVPSASLPAIPIPSTPTRARSDKRGGDPTVDESFVNANNKRVMSSPSTPSNPDRALKKARTLPHTTILEGLPSTPFSRIRVVPDEILAAFPRTPKTPTERRGASAAVRLPPAAAVPGPSTSSPLSSVPPSSSPKKQAMPTLLELLASSKKRNKYTSKSSSKKVKEVMPQPRVIPAAQEEEEEEEEEARDQIVDNSPIKPITVHVASPKPAPAPVSVPILPDLITTTTTGFYDPVDIPSLFPAAAEDQPLFLDDDIPLPSNISPSKSLSSLAGSDSEQEDDNNGLPDPDDIGFSFRPLATSTQRGPFADSGSIGNGYLNANAVASGSGSAGPNASGINPKDQQIPHPGLSQSTKDSWESIYAPSGDRPPTAPPSHPSSLPVIPDPMPKQPQHYTYNYSSQFNTDVAKNVDDVDQLLRQDVELAGWIRDPYADDEEGNGVPDSSP